MIELDIPKQESFEEINAIFQNTIRSLPLDGCRTTRDPLLGGRLEFLAPDGYVFQVVGSFEAEKSNEAFEPNDTVRPDGQHFFGTRLQIALGERGITYYGDRPQPKYMSYDSDFRPHITIGAPLDYVMSGATTHYSWEQHPGSGIYSIAQIYDPYGGDPIPFAASASGWLSELDIQLVPGRYPKRDLRLPVDPLVKKALSGFQTVEVLATPTEAEYHEAISRSAIADVAGFVAYKKEQYRELGIGFRDDPLRDITIVREDESGEVPSIFKLLEKVDKERAYFGLQSFAARDEYRFLQEQAALIADRAKQIEKRLFVSNTGDVLGAIALHAQPDWVDRQIEAEGWNNDRDLFF